MLPIDFTTKKATRNSFKNLQQCTTLCSPQKINKRKREYIFCVSWPSDSAYFKKGKHKKYTIDWFYNYNCFAHVYSILTLFFFLSFCSTPAKLNGHAQLDVPGLSQNEIQGLLLGSHQSQQAINVKREPEDLRIDPKCPRSQKVSKMSFFSFFIASSVTHYLSRFFNVGTYTLF